MLSRTTRAASGARRAYATVVDAGHGVRVAATDANAPTASVTLLVPAGTRHAPKAGAAQALKHFAFKTTGARSALATIRETELYGGVLSTALTREHLAISAEFMKGDEAFFVDLLSTFATQSTFARHEFEEAVMPAVEAEALQAAADARTLALETAHRLAFRTGLGLGLFAPSHAPVNVNDVRAFAHGALAPGRLAFLSTGLEADALARLVGDKFKAAAGTGAMPAAQATKYFGGESRMAGTPGSVPTAFIGFGHTGGASGALAALAAHLDPAPSVKWGTGSSPLAGHAARAVYLPYSDAGLVGVLVQAPTEGALRDAARAALDGMKAAASGLDKDAAARAVAKARFAAASALDGRDGYTHALAPKLLAGDNGPATDVLKAFEGLDAKAIAGAAEAALKAKPVYVAVGDVTTLPYADEFGL